MIAEILSVVGALMIIVNLITEIAKKLGLKKTNLFVVILSEVLTLVCFFAYVDIKQFNIEWYFVVGAVSVPIHDSNTGAGTDNDYYTRWRQW